MRFGAWVLPEYWSSSITESHLRHQSNLNYSKTFSGKLRVRLPEQSPGLVVLGEGFNQLVLSEDNFVDEIAARTDFSVYNLGTQGVDLAGIQRLLEVSYRFQPKLILMVVNPEDLSLSQTPIRELYRKNAQKALPGDEALFVDGIRIAQIFWGPIQMLESLSWGAQWLVEGVFRKNTRPVYSYQMSGWEIDFDYPRSSSKLSFELFSDFLYESRVYASAIRSDFLVVLVPPKKLVHSHLFNLEQKRALGIEAGEESYSRFFELLNFERVPSLDLLSTFQHHARREERLFHVHQPYLNARGHEVMAEAVLKHLESDFEFQLVEEGLL